MNGGYVGKILRVDLSTGTMTTLIPPNMLPITSVALVLAIGYSGKKQMPTPPSGARKTHSFLPLDLAVALRCQHQAELR